MRRRVPLIAGAALAIAAIVLAAGSLAFHPNVPRAHAEGDVVLPVTHEHFNSLETHGVSDSGDPISLGSFKNSPPTLCSTATSAAADVNTDCELGGNTPHNETSIAVNPTNPLNMLGSVNDYQIIANPGGAIKETLFSRGHVTFDGGKTWSMYSISYNNYVFTGDPAVAFDAAGNAYLATLGFGLSQGNGCCTNPDILVAHSSDGGKTWSKPVRVAQGSGSFGSVGTFNDKEYITAWGDGNAIVTWTVFNDDNKGSYISSPIFAVVTHDGGKTFTSGVEISGSASFCIGAQGGNTCNQDQASVPTVAADGSIYVAFLNTADLTTFRDQYLVVKVDPSTGQRAAGPFNAGGLIDGATDYPISVDGRQTYHDSEFRTWGAGNITADPTNAQHLAVIWSDMRNSTLPAPADPFAANTNSDIVVSQSFDGGATWSPATAIAKPGDQFMPWGIYDAGGKLRVGYFDRSYDAANHKYGYTLATETVPGTLSFGTTQLTTALSDPTSGDRWFSGGVVNNATTFLGDYSGIAATPGGGVVALWTDLRNNVCFTTRCGTGENSYFAAHA